MLVINSKLRPYLAPFCHSITLTYIQTEG